jgi:hypothetical protein
MRKGIVRQYLIYACTVQYIVKNKAKVLLIYMFQTRIT